MDKKIIDKTRMEQKILEHKIQEELAYIEKDWEVRVLFACEAGNRALGFPSPDSPYEVHFIYVHSLEWYLRIDQKVDFMAYTPNVDGVNFRGYELRDMLRRFRSYDPALYDWLQSPTVYRQEAAFVEEIKSLMYTYFLKPVGQRYYLENTRKIVKEHLQGEVVSLAQYFYALRSVLAAYWITNHGNFFPPMAFYQLRDVINDPVVNARIDSLLQLKAAAAEGHTVERDAVLNAFIEQTLDQSNHWSQHFNHPDATPLNDLFLKMVGVRESGTQG